MKTEQRIKKIFSASTLWSIPWMKHLAGIFFPKACLVCGKETEDADLCGDCRKHVRYIEPPFCMRCGKPFISKEGISHRCMDCIKDKNRFVRARAVFEYSGAIPKLVQGFKFSDRVDLSSFFIKEMAGVYRRDFARSGIQAVVPVPLSGKRLKQRSYNQAMLLAMGLSRGFSVRCCPGILEKTRETPPQSTLLADKRRENVKGAYAVSDIHMLKGKKVLLVDDVITTGATVNACTAALMRAGIKQVYVLAAAMRV
jgi:ComF family protein